MNTTSKPSLPSQAWFSMLHPDIIESHILSRLDGASIASASCCSTFLHHLSSQPHLWLNICHSMWPSTTSQVVTQLISKFPEDGPRTFFAHSSSLPLHASNNGRSSSTPLELISAVDIYYKNKLIFTKVEETETMTGWFRYSPFRIDLLEPKDVVHTAIKHPDGDDACLLMFEDMTLSWILIDPIGRQAVNLSSHKPVSVQRHWLSGEVQVQFTSILAADQKGSPWRQVQCGIVVTCWKSDGGEMQVREVSMDMENMDGMHLNGRDSLVILQRALESKKGKAMNREEEGRRRYKEYVEMKIERKEKKLRTEGTLDILCVAFGESMFVAFWWFVWCR